MFTSAFAPYLPSGSTSLVVTASAQALGAVDQSGRCVAFRFANVGTLVTYFLAAAQGQPAPVATAANGVPLQPGSVEVFTLPPNPQISAIGASTGSTLTVTPGEGV
jgi:FtsP/CotA-like multicopper oxidase with cupredoxin domain